MTATLYARGPFQAGGVVILEEDEAHHLKVRRVSDGDSVRLVDGRGGIATARVSWEKEVAAARVVATAQVPAPAATELLVGAGDRDRFLLLVEKATELGATKLVPLMSERSQQVATRFVAAHVEKALRRAREAVKQSGAPWLPVIAPPQPLTEALRQAPPKVVRLLADADGAALPAIGEGDAVQWAIGPEGGFSDIERSVLQAAGFKAVSLGRSVLRFETAAIAALAVTATARNR